jgi:hypothetical protein
MNCRACKSENVRRFAGELTASSLKIQNVTNDPVYVCEDVLICVDCGFTELVIPPQELGKLKRNAATTGS